MSKTLNLVDRLLAMGRNFREQGRDQDALGILERLAGFRELPVDTAEETQVLLTEILLKRRKFHKARRHLSAALIYQPRNARFHFMMATAWNSGSRRDSARALEHYRKSLELDPEQADCHADFGLFASRVGLVDDAQASLRHAAELAPDDPTILAKVVKGWRRLEKPDEARRQLIAGLFRHSRDSRFRKLWNDFQFQQLRETQTVRRSQSAASGNGGPTLLPFLRVSAGTQTPNVKNRLVRRDGASPPPPPHLPRPGRLPGRKHAQ